MVVRMGWSVIVTVLYRRGCFKKAEQPKGKYLTLTKEGSAIAVLTAIEFESPRATHLDKRYDQPPRLIAFKLT